MKPIFVLLFICLWSIQKKVLQNYGEEEKNLSIIKKLIKCNCSFFMGMKLQGCPNKLKFNRIKDLATRGAYSFNIIMSSWFYTESSWTSPLLLLSFHTVNAWSVRTYQYRYTYWLLDWRLVELYLWQLIWYLTDPV